MSEDVRVATAPPTPLGRYRLRTHELAPVLLPRARALSSSSPTNTEHKTFTSALPARPRGSITYATSPRRGCVRLESVAFDPFSDSESFKLLLQNPHASRARREDPRAVSTFRHWLSRSFPQLLRTLGALGMIKTHQQDDDFADTLVEQASANQCTSPFNETTEESTNVAQDKLEVDGEESWRLLLRYATVQSATPGDILALQNTTATESVHFLLNGHCTLSFRPVLLRDGKAPSTPSSLPRMQTATPGCSDGPVMHLRELAAGDCFGLDAAAFGFEYHLSTATTGSARQRNFLGLREVALTYVLYLPYAVVQQLQLVQRQHHNGNDRLPPAFPYSFTAEAELFLRNTFLFRAMADSSRRFLAAHLHQVAVAQQEYLFTPGQPVRVFIVINGQLTLGDPREERAGEQKEADLELEIMQTHDSVGFAEVLSLATSFERYCVVTSASGVRAYALPSTVLLMVLAQESSSLKLIQEWISHRKAWFELRRATALAQRKKLVAEGSQHVVRLTLAAQRRSKLTCSRCGWAGHVSTSSCCVRTDVPVANSRASLSSRLDTRVKKSRGDNRAARHQTRRSHRSETITQPLPPATPDSPSKTSAHRRLQVDSMALRALRISKISTTENVLSNEPTDHDEERREKQVVMSGVASSTKSMITKRDTEQNCTLIQSLQRLEAALQHNKTPPATPRQKINGKSLHISS